jgi:hypothetical protein
MTPLESSLVEALYRVVELIDLSAPGIRERAAVSEARALVVFANTPPAKRCACGDCDWVGVESGLARPLKDCANLRTRLEPGHPVPVGECPECESFCYIGEKI